MKSFNIHTFLLVLKGLLLDVKPSYSYFILNLDIFHLIISNNFLIVLMILTIVECHKLGIEDLFLMEIDKLSNVAGPAESVSKVS